MIMEPEPRNTSCEVQTGRAASGRHPYRRVVGGPIGLLAGFKVAGVAAAVSEGLLSCTGGNLNQKNRKTRIDQDLKELSSDQSDSKSE
ncbi:hypothetical protein EOD39_5440 [Acipenser ruthenus]|uniref:Uncharacterized protein n=1 Tax=Acipenser ruthenus TaxID=7906 RepID=A0A444UE52_ACIRT|nr:hypothetical protein EOD39_5440 [Acipenser ruthenus]